jgi:hypothetical protein
LIGEKIPALMADEGSGFAEQCDALRNAVEAGDVGPEEAEDLYWCLAGTSGEAALAALADRALPGHPSAAALRLTMAKHAAKRSFWDLAFRRYAELLEEDPAALFTQRTIYADLATAAVRTDNLPVLLEGVTDRLLPALDSLEQPVRERILDQSIRLGRRLNHADLRQGDAAYALLCRVGSWCHERAPAYDSTGTRAESEAVIVLADLKDEHAYAEMIARLAPHRVTEALAFPVRTWVGGDLTLHWSWFDHTIRCLLDTCLDRAEQTDGLETLAAALRSVPEDSREDEWIWLALIALRQGDMEAADVLRSTGCRRGDIFDGPGGDGSLAGQVGAVRDRAGPCPPRPFLHHGEHANLLPGQGTRGVGKAECAPGS